MAALARTPVLTRARALGPLSAQLRRPRPQSATSAIRRLQTSLNVSNAHKAAIRRQRGNRPDSTRFCRSRSGDGGQLGSQERPFRRRAANAKVRPLLPSKCGRRGNRKKWSSRCRRRSGQPRNLFRDNYLERLAASVRIARLNSRKAIQQHLRFFQIRGSETFREARINRRKNFAAL
jgi:hypothetical protein